MNRFLINALKFATLLVAINLLMYMILEPIYLRKYNQIDITFSKYLLADSHGERLGNYAETFGIYNFTADSDSYQDMLRKLKFLVKNTNVDTIFISSGDHLLSEYREDMNNIDRSVVFTYPNEFKSKYQYFKNKYLIYYFPLFNPKTRLLLKGYISSRVEAFFSNNSNGIKDNIAWEDVDIEEKIKFSEGRAKNQFPNSNKSVILEQNLLEIIQICQSNNIELIGIKFPLTIEYYNALKNRDYAENDVLSEHGYNILDFTKEYFDKPNFFYNPDHLNQQGGECFANKLGEWLKNEIKQQ